MKRITGRYSVCTAYIQCGSDPTATFTLTCYDGVCTVSDADIYCEGASYDPFGTLFEEFCNQ